MDVGPYQPKSNIPGPRQDERNETSPFSPSSSHLWSRAILTFHYTMQMPWHCQHWTIQRLISMHSSSSSNNVTEVLLWEENTKAQLQFVALASTLVAGVTGASVAWTVAESAHWMVLVLWYGSLVMGLYSVIIAFHLSIMLSAYDVFAREERAERLSDMLKHAAKEEPRWRSQWVLQMPVALFSWSVISYLVGLALLVVRPLWTMGWVKESWVCAPDYPPPPPPPPPPPSPSILPFPFSARALRDRDR
ncbi:MAG: hypothetical protein Q9178_000716 [Gyalolechia marmorata]